jgi:hypothetical protein
VSYSLTDSGLVRIIIQEIPKENWGKGGVPASELNWWIDVSMVHNATDNEVVGH